MIQRLLATAVLILAASSVTLAQLRPTCGTAEKMAEQLQTDPGLWERRMAIQEFTERWIEENANAQERVVYTIPVVVHVVYANSAQNISDAQINSQIDVLNEDYRANNSDISGVPSVWNSLIADCEIEFALAERTPDGQETDGITRTETSVSNWNGSDNVKFDSQGGKNAWPANKYLNIWVCNIGSGLLGYAYQPGISASLDGLVIGYRYFGTEGNISPTYNLGRTATHEIGHYFNLDHLWGPGGNNTNCSASDFVSDTPVQEAPNYGCTNFPSVSCSNGPNGDMFNNFMDYGDDDCLFFFTNGQKSRMLAALNGPRASLKTSNGLTPPTVGIYENELANLSVYPNPTKAFVTLDLSNSNAQKLDVRILNSLGQRVYNKQEIGSKIITLDLSELSNGSYVLVVNSEHSRVARLINIVR